MFELFKKTGGKYIFPTGRSVTSEEIVADPQYAILADRICVVDVVDGVLRSYSTLASMAEDYGVDYGDSITEDNAQEVLDIVKNKYKEHQQEISEIPTPNVMAASARVAQIMAMSFTDEQALEVKEIYPEYQVDHAYKQGDFFTHEGKLYKVNQAHTSASQWEPSSVGTESLYTHLTLNEDGYPIWKQPTGAHDAYNKGDIVEYNGELYKSLIDGNAYSPDAYPAGWEKYTEPTE